MPEQEVTLKANLDDSEIKAKIQALSDAVDALQRKLQGLNTGAGGATGALGGSQGVATPGGVSTPPINGVNGGAAAMGIPSGAQGAAPVGRVPANGAPGGMTRTATDGTVVSYDPRSGSWSIVNGGGASGGGAASGGSIAPPVNGGAGGGSRGGGRGGDWQAPGHWFNSGSGAPNWNTINADVTANNLWMADELDALQNTGRGPLDAGAAKMAGVYFGARTIASVINHTSQTYAESSRTGRNIQWYDYAQQGGTLTGALAGAAFGSIFPGIGTVAGAIGGAIIVGAGGEAYTTYARVKEEEAYSGAMLRNLGARGINLSGYKARERAAIADMATGMGGGYYSTTHAKQFVDRLLDQAGNDNGARMLAFDEAGAATSAMEANPGLYDVLHSPFSSATAFSFLRAGGPKALSGYLGQSGRTVAAAYIEAMRKSNVLKSEAELAGIYPQQAAFATQTIAERGGSASQIAGGMAGQINALERAAGAQRAYISSLEAQGAATAPDKAIIEQAKAALAGLTAQIAQLGHAAALVQSQERRDIAGTGMAVASSGRAMAMMTMGRGGNIGGAYAGEMSAASALVSTLEGELNRPGLTPSDRRAIERELASAKVSAMGTMQDAASAAYGIPAQLAGLDAAFSASYANIAGMGLTDPVQAAGLTARVGQAQGRSAGALWNRYTGMRDSGLFNAVQLGEAKNAAYGAAAQGLATLNASSVFSPTPTQEAAMAGLGVEAFAARRAGGSIGALSAVGRQQAMLSDQMAQAGVVRDQALSNGVNPNVANANYAMAAAAIGQQQQSLTASLGHFGVSPETGGRMDAARHAFGMMMASPFVSGNRLDAGTALLGSYQGAIGEAQNYLSTAPLDAEGRRNVQQTIFGYQEEAQRLRETLNVGWTGRLAQMQIGAPSHSAMVAVSNRDYLMVDPTGNRLYGTASRRSYEYTEGAPYAASTGTTAGSQPGNMNAQGQQAAAEVVISFDWSAMELFRTLGIQARAAVRHDPQRVAAGRVPTG